MFILTNGIITKFKKISIITKQSCHIRDDSLCGMA